MKSRKIRPYHPSIKLDVYTEMEKHYDIMLDSNVHMIAPRIWYNNRVMFKDIVYYISILYENELYDIDNGIQVADIGSGESIWSDWFNYIISFEPNPSVYSNEPNYKEHFDNKFIKKYNNYFDCGMAINSLHFVPFDKVNERLDSVMSIVKDRFLITFNLKMVWKASNNNDITGYDYEFCLNKLLNILNNTKYNIVMLDYIGDDNDIGPVNGHIRLVIENVKIR